MKSRYRGLHRFTGHGMGLAVGMALIILLEIKNIFTNYDGELQEGSTWENMMMAAN